MTFDGYKTDGFCEEMFLPDDTSRPEASPLVERVESRSLLVTSRSACDFAEARIVSQELG